MQLAIKTGKILSICLVIIMGCFTSCLKDKNGLTNLSGQSSNAFIEIPDGGLGNFASSALNLSGTTPDTLLFYVNLAYKETFPKDITVSLDFDATALTAYNSGSATQYTKFPDSIFSFAQKQVVITAGQRVAAVRLIVFPAKIDPTKNYMLPITVKDAQGTLISGNFGTKYYHLIGNPVAGSYTVVGTRLNYSGPVGSNTPSVTNLTGTKIASPVDAKNIAVDYANLGGSSWQYIITYDGTNISAAPNQTMSDGITAGSFKLYFITYDAVLKQIHVKSEYTNTAGSSRLVEETLTHQ